MIMNWFLVITQILILVAVLLMPYMMPFPRMGEAMMGILIRLEKQGIIEFKNKKDRNKENKSEDK